MSAQLQKTKISKKAHSKTKISKKAPENKDLEKSSRKQKARVFYLVSRLKRRSLFAADWRYTYAASPHSLGLVTKIPSNDLKIHPEILQKIFNI